MKRIMLLILALFCAPHAFAAEEVEPWVVGLYEARQLNEMPYRLMTPQGFDSLKSYPVIVSLHGGGGTGTDNVKQLRKWNQFLAEKGNRKAYPCYVLAPQTTELWNASDLSKIKEIIAGLPSVDMDRIYILGHSMGGHGTYVLTQLDPGYFAAAAPSAGSGLTRTEDFVDVSLIKDIPFWIFHGDQDPKCPIEKDQKVFAAMKRVGGNMKFTTWKGDKHGGPVALKMMMGSDNGTTELSSDRCDPESVFLKWLFAQKRSAGLKPNVIYILADDLGYGDLSCYGQSRFQTPNIDALAAKGMKFTHHDSGSPVCAPSRCTLMTGQHTGHAPIRGNGKVEPEGQRPMPPDTFTLAHLSQNAGYATGIFGKWGLGAPGSGGDPLQMGFDRFYGYNCQQQEHFYYPYFLWNDNQREILWNNFGLETGDYAPDLIQDQALRFIETNKDQLFFCYYALIQPHADMAAPEEYMQKYRGKFLPENSFEGTDSGPGFRKNEYGSQPEAHAAFAAMVHVMDDDVGELVAKLEELGIADNTLIIFSSDNGPHQEGGHDPEYFNSNGLQRGIKRDLYEGGIRVPMIANWPGKVASGAESDHLSAFWDVLPTMAELIGEPVPSDSVCYQPDQTFGTFKGSADAIDFPHNCDPDLFAERGIPVYADMYLRKADDLRKLENFVSIHWGPEPPASVEIEVDAAALGLRERPSFSEIVSDTPMQVEKSSKGWKLTLPMEKNMTRVIRIR